MFNDCYKGRKVFVTGDTGFKGSWLTLWLDHLNAEVTGYSRDIPTSPNHFELLNSDHSSVRSDIADPEALFHSLKEAAPEIVFHLAAQPLVRYSYENPVETYNTNVMGTLSLLEAVRRVSSVKAVVIVTSDKCYENREQSSAFTENDPMGGFDPYSSSKGCAELLTSSYRNSYFNPLKYGVTHNTLVATVRAGNVIGGGDWGDARLIPDIMKAASEHEAVVIRNPYSVRPWQHVLEPLSGYLMLGQKLLEGDTDSASGWNFGPENEDHFSVGEISSMFKEHWKSVSCEYEKSEEFMHEAAVLKLDCSKAKTELLWEPVWSGEQTVSKTAEWYRVYYEENRVITRIQLEEYIENAHNKDCVWTR